jgi:3-methyladenine DNA glycosylase AlkD
MNSNVSLIEKSVVKSIFQRQTRSFTNQSVKKTSETGEKLLNSNKRKRESQIVEIKSVKKSLFVNANILDNNPYFVSSIKKTDLNKKKNSIHLETFLKELKQMSNSKVGKKMKKSLKSAHEHLGVNASQCAMLARTTSKTLEEAQVLVLAEALWQTNLFEAKICSAKLLELPKVQPSQDLWNLILSFLNDIDNWAIEDQLAKAAQKCILEDEKRLDDIEKWTEHSSFWVRRAALVYTLPFAKPKRNPERMLKWAAKYASDKEWFIQKAIGWWLRELGTHNPEAVFLFLKEHWINLQKVAKKEATRKLSAKWTEKISSL